MLENAPVCATLPVTDVERATHFYRDVLGLKVADQAMPGGVMFTCGQGTMLVLYQRGPSKADHTVAGFVVNDLAAVMADLRAKGVAFEEYDFPGLKTEHGVATMDNTQSAWFKDPDGNILAINQMK